MKTKNEKAVGIDVSAKELYVAVEDDAEVQVFGNDAEGHKQLIASITKGRRRVRVVLEATGTYHLDAAIALSGHKRCRVSVVNPKTTKHFHQAQNIRAKTDRVDARSLCQYALRMEFIQWILPDSSFLELRALVRYRQQLIKDQTRLKTQSHAANVSKTTPKWLIKQLALRLEVLSSQIAEVALELDSFELQHPAIHRRIEQSMSMPGVGRVTAQRLVSEYLLLDPTMTSAQITAWAGLDPRPDESGTSLKGRRAISKRGSSRARATLYMSAVTAIRMPGPNKDLYDRVHRRSGHKMIGIVAVMRKLLIISWAMHRADTSWDAQKAMPRNKKIKKAA